MTRQQKLPGTDEDRKVDPELQKQIDRYIDARDTRMEQTKIEKREKDALIAALQARGSEVVVFLDDEGDERTAKLEHLVNVKVRKTGNADSEVGDGVEVGPDDPVPEGLLKRAAEAQDAAAANGHANGEKPKAKRGRPKKAQAEA